MSAVEKLTELHDRVMAAKGPDRLLDALIEVEARRFDAYSFGLTDEQRAKWAACTRVPGFVDDGFTRYEANRFTASIDVALALVERVLPDLPIVMGRSQTARTIPWARIGSPEFGVDTTATTLPLAILAALLSALVSKEPQP